MAKLKYDESFPGRAREYAAAGMNDSAIARQLEIGSETFYAYKRQFPEFAEAVTAGRQVIDDDLETSVIDMATGNCFVTAVTSGSSGRETKTVRQRVPNLKAIINWLKRNKQYADEEPAGLQEAKTVSVNSMTNLKYDASFPEKVEARAGNGDTDSRIARRLGISPASFYNYKKQFPEFAEALECGRRQCYGRMRKQLLSMALGECAVRTETYRDGDLYKTTLRQLPPNLPAIKYWLAQRDSKLSGMSGNNESASVQRDSKLSGMGLKANGAYGTNEAYGRKTGKTEDVSVQRDSKLSGMDGKIESASAQAVSKLSGTGLEGNGGSETCGTYGPKTDKTEDVSVQRDSKLSGMYGNNESASAQAVSKLSGTGGRHFDFAKLHKLHKSHRSHKSRRR